MSALIELHLTQQQSGSHPSGHGRPWEASTHERVGLSLQSCIGRHWLRVPSMMPSPAASFQTVSPAQRSAVSHQMQRSCLEAVAARGGPCKAWPPLVGVSRRRLACRVSSMPQRASSSAERIVSGDNAVTVLPDDGRAAAVIRVDAPADDLSAQSQQFGSPAAADAAHLNSGARRRRREQRQRCA